MSRSKNDQSSVQKRTCSQRGHDSVEEDVDSGVPKRREMREPEYQRILREYERLPRSPTGRHIGSGDLCKKWSISRQTLYNIVERDQDPSRDGQLAALPRSGRPTVMTPTKIKALLNIVKKHAGFVSTRNVERRMLCIGRSSKGISRSTVCTTFRTSEWRKALHATRPSLTEEQQQARLTWAQQHMNDTYDAQVEIDEKWFYGGTLNGRLYIPANMVAARRKLRNKRFIPKVLVVTAVAKPDPSRNFDGKIGWWPVVASYEAKRSSRFHSKGDLYLKQSTLNAANFEAIIVKLVVPKIRKLMPWCTEITVQMDNAPPHSKTKGISTRINIRRSDRHTKIELVKQPPQSPDTNINDLGLYNSLQRRIDRSLLPCNTIFEVLRAVRLAWRKLEPATLTSLFRVKHDVLQSIIDHDGSNEFVVPHSR